MLNKMRDILGTDRDRNEISSAIPTKSGATDLMVTKELGQRSRKVGHADRSTANVK
jgi:hypothetical protein